MKLTTFKHKRDNEPVHVEMDWPGLVKLLTKHRTRNGKDGKLWSPAFYSNGDLRANDNVQAVSALVLDFDAGKTYEDVCGPWEGLEHVVHSTYSHGPELAKWRAVFPFGEPVKQKDWPTVYRKITAVLGGDHIDESCTDCSRMYYVPSCPEKAESYKFAFHKPGKFIDPADFPDLEPDVSRYSTHIPERNYLSAKKPGEELERRYSWAQILEPHGWTFLRTSGERTYWTRPGKTSDISASTGNGPTDLLYVHTSNAQPLQSHTSYSKFGAYTVLNYGGDFTASASALKEQFNPQSSGKVAANPERFPEIVTPPRKWANMADVDTAEIEWLWRPYLPIGVVTLAYGDSGIGKSTAILAAAAAMSRGVAPPNGKAEEPFNVIVLSAEDPATTVIKPRLLRLEADPSRFTVPEEHTPEGLSNPLRLDADGIDELTEQVIALKARLVVVDPLRAYFMAAADMNNQTDARSFMRMLTGVATGCKCAIVLVHHVNKGIGNNVRYRASGSQDFIDACRSALYFHQDPDDETNCAITHVKHNYSAKGKTLGYTIKLRSEDPDDWEFGWTGDSDLTPEDTAQAPKEKISPKKLEAAKRWLYDLLDRNGSMVAPMVFEAAKMDGVSAATLRRAKSDLGVLSTKLSGDGGWDWSLPTGSQPWWADKEDPYA